MLRLACPAATFVRRRYAPEQTLLDRSPFRHAVCSGATLPPALGDLFPLIGVNEFFCLPHTLLTTPPSPIDLAHRSCVCARKEMFPVSFCAPCQAISAKRGKTHERATI
jgi:hypothetical protein